MGRTFSEIAIKPQSNRISFTKAIMIAAISLMAALRAVALDSDAYSRLSYSSALLTDEGFYIHNARNSVLFGHERTDQFNNMLIMPVLHQIQVWVFSAWGVGAIQARSISVVAGLISIVVLYFTIRKCFGTQIACVGILLLGLGHANLLYSRMALMDTPAALGLVCVFALWIFGVYRLDSGLSMAGILFTLSGAMIALTYATRGLAAWILPVPIVLLLYRSVTDKDGRLWKTAALAQAAGLGLGVSIYLLTWYLPHHSEIGKVTTYYVMHQMLPDSLFGLRENITHAVVGDFRGLSPYLFRHSPVEYGLTLALLCVGSLNLVRNWRITRNRQNPRGSNGQMSIFALSTDSARQRRLSEMAGWYLSGWLLVSWITYSVISYSPDRYYVLFYPAMAAITAVALFRARELHASLRATWVFTVMAGFLAYHGGEAFLHHSNNLALSTIVVVVAGLSTPFTETKVAAFGWRLIYNPALLLVMWAIVNTFWTTDWLRHLTYVRSRADSWLARNLPSNSVLIGDVAPGLCLDNRFTTVPVIPGLCNEDGPLEHYANLPRYIVILDERFLEKFWTKRYSAALTYERRICLFPSVIKFPVGIYRVGDSPGVGGYTY
jgi:4-amino-4-deoxy-L-arabinose transferase-like glycosyltransferase